tara:strand:- start:7677 stop:8351 length:675 start_codon:yes stop_codon:yes gene_type:complete
MKKSYKILIIGDSNCLPKYSNSKQDSLPIENIYTHKLKKRLKSSLFSEVIWGGITTSMLINYSISYYKQWKPDYIIVHSGVNDVKTQLFSEKTNQRIFKIFKIFNYDQKKFKNNIIYNPSYLKYKNTNKVNPVKFLANAKKLKKNFRKSKIIWIGIHSNKNINLERPDTLSSVSIFNEKLKKLFKKNFVGNDFKDICFRKDGYHLNYLGHNILLKKILKLIKEN